MSYYILAIDQGTTSSKAMLLNITSRFNVKITSQYSEKIDQIYPKSSWVEQDLEKIWESVEKAIWNTIAIAKHEQKDFSPEDIVCIGITNQRETLCAYHPQTGKPYGNAISWQCKRSLDICKELVDRGLESVFHEKTGLKIDPYFSGTKLKWWLENDKNLKELAIKGEVAFSTIDTFILNRLTAGESFKTEPSNASRTLLFNINTLKWDEDLLSLLDIPQQIKLPEVVDSSSVFGHTKSLDYLPNDIPICGILGDQQAALIGQMGVNTGDTKCTYGTGAFVLSNLGKKPAHFPDKLLTTLLYKTDKETVYALEGSSFIAGAGIDFLKNNLELIKSSDEIKTEIEPEEEGAPDVYFVPAFSGLGTPHWNPSAKAALVGLTRDTKKEKIISATIEGIAFSVNDILDEMNKYTVKPIENLKVDGGVSKNDRLLQFQSKISKVKINRLATQEATLTGAALIAAYGASVFSVMSDIQKCTIIQTTFHPNFAKEDEQKIKDIKSGWQRAVKAVQVFSEE